MKGNTIKVAVGLLVLSLLVVPLAGACGPAPPPEEKTVLIGCQQDFSGPTSLPSAKLLETATQFVKWANETNLVPGVKVELTTADDRYDAAQVPLAYREMMVKNPDVIFTMTSVTSAGVKPLVDRDKIPLLSITGSVAIAEEPVGYVFQVSFVPEIDFNCFLNYVADTWKEAKPCRIASLSWDNDEGRQHIESGAATATALGIDFKREYAEIAPPGTMDFSTYVTRLKEINPDYIYFPLIGPATGSALKTIDAVGMDTKKAVYIIMSAGGMYEDLTAVAGEELTYGAIVVMPAYAYSDPLITEDQERLRGWAQQSKYGWDPRYHIDWTQYYQSCKVFYEALRIAVKDVGVENLDSEAIYNALQEIKDFDTGVALPLTFGSDDRLAVQSDHIYEIGTDGIAHLKTDKVYNWPQKWGPDLY